MFSVDVKNVAALLETAAPRHVKVTWQFKDFLKDLEAEYGDVIYFSEVRWLSRGQTLKRFYDLKAEVQLFMEMKGKSFPEFEDEVWLSEFAILVDITNHLNELNSKLQKQNQFVHELFAHIKAFKNKLLLW